jgi:hypothetical protein
VAILFLVSVVTLPTSFGAIPEDAGVTVNSILFSRTPIDTNYRPHDERAIIAEFKNLVTTDTHRLDRPISRTRVPILYVVVNFDCKKRQNVEIDFIYHDKGNQEIGNSFFSKATQLLTRDIKRFAVDPILNLMDTCCIAIVRLWCEEDPTWHLPAQRFLEAPGRWEVAIYCVDPPRAMARFLFEVTE